MFNTHRTLALVVAVWLFQSAGIAAELLKVDYEDGRITLPEIGVSAVFPQATDAIRATKDFSRSGVYSVRTKVDHTEQYISTGKHRAESDASKSGSARYNSGDRRRYQFSVMLDSDWQVSKTTAVDILWQFKRTAGGPDMFVAVKRGSIVLRHLKDQDVLVKSYKPGEWMDFRFDISWSAEADGSVECWVRTGKDTTFSKVLTYSGPNMDGTRTKEFGYVKWGLYCPDAERAVDITKARIVYHDDIVIADLP